MERLLILASCVVILLIAAAIAVSAGSLRHPQDNLNLLNFKPCKTVSTIQRCKVKEVQIKGCLQQDISDLNRLLVKYNPCEVTRNSHLNFTITLQAGFTSDKLFSQFSVMEYPQDSAECSNSVVRQPSRCPRKGSDTDCAPASHNSDPCLFQEYIRDSCRGGGCPLTVQDPQEVTDYLKINPDTAIRGTYIIQWKLWNKSNKKDYCCFTFKIKYT
ncbi:hypothetical protein J6590_083585 [Homalodisca vitripennis]|nr:hypothetical protein J6590_083585 [Homalodisca vitripennis]